MSEQLNPIWPVDDIDEWRKQVAENKKAVEAQAKYAEEQKKLIEQTKKEMAEKRRNQEAERQSKIKRERIKRLEEARARIRTKPTKETHGGSMENGLKKTALVDSLIKDNLGSKEDKSGSYAPGAVQTIVDTVLESFPDLDAKALKGLVFSRRAVISKAAQKASEEPAAEPVEA